MKKILKEIQDGSYASAWVEENRTGRAWFERRRRRSATQLLERVGRDLRARMPFLDPVDVTNPSPSGPLIRFAGCGSRSTAGPPHGFLGFAPPHRWWP